jgi:hypothetical protein
VTQDAFQKKGVSGWQGVLGWQGFLSRFDDRGKLIYSSYITNDSSRCKLYLNRIVIDKDRNIFLSGSTNSTLSFISPWAVQKDKYDNTNYIGFIIKFDPACHFIKYATYLGGIDPYGRTEINGIAVDDSGYAVVVGSTLSLDFPTVNAYCNWAKGIGTANGTAFISKINLDGSGLIYSSLLDSEPDSWAYCVTLDRCIFRHYPTSDSERIRPLIPIQSDH